MIQLPFAPSRRQATLALLSAGLLAGCASRSPKPAPSARSAPPARTHSRGGLSLHPSQREAVVAQTMLLVNTPYTYGGNTPQGGFDCSGLIQYVLRQVAGAQQALPRTTAQWAAASTPVPQARLQRGDLVFFNTTGKPYSHMGLYVGGGQFVHAPSTGGTVRKASLGNRYFAPRYLGARRVFAA